MTSPITREEALSVFSEDQLRTYTTRAVQHIRDVETRDILMNVGLPDWPVIGLGFPETNCETLALVRDWGSLREYTRTDFLPSNSEDWPVLAVSWPTGDTVILNPDHGTVIFVRDDEYFPINTDLKSYIRFLIVLKREAPMNPHNDFEEFFDLDTEPIRRNIQEQWRRIDPPALGRRSALWYEILLQLHDPEAYHNSCAEEYPYPYFEEDIIRSHENKE